MFTYVLPILFHLIETKTKIRKLFSLVNLPVCFVFSLYDFDALGQIRNSSSSIKKAISQHDSFRHMRRCFTFSATQESLMRRHFSRQFLTISLDNKELEPKHLYIRTVSFQCLLSTLLIQFELFFEPFGQCTLLLLPFSQEGNKYTTTYTEKKLMPNPSASSKKIGCVQIFLTAFSIF